MFGHWILLAVNIFNVNNGRRKSYSTLFTQNMQRGANIVSSSSTHTLPKIELVSKREISPKIFDS